MHKQKIHSESTDQKILVFDPQELYVNELTTILDQSDLNHVVSTSEFQLLRILENNNVKTIILANLNERNRFEICSKLLAAEWGNKPRILFLSSPTDEKTILEGYKAGCSDYISIPLRKQELLARVFTQINESTPERQDNSSFSVSENHKKDEKSKQQLLKLNAIIETIPDILLTSNNQGNILEALNPRTQQLLEKNHIPLGTNIKQILSPENASLILDKINTCIKTRKTIRFEYSTQSKEKLHFYEESMTCIDNNTVLRMLHEITHRRQIEMKILQNEERLRLLFNSITEGLIEIDIEGQITSTNHAAATMLGYNNLQELVGENLPNVLSSNNRSDFENENERCTILDAAKNKQKYHCDEKIFTKKSGETFLAEFWAHPIMKNDEVIGAVITFIDITERNKTLEVIRHERQMLRTLIDNLPVTIYVKDNEGRKLIANKADVAMLCKENEDEVVGKTDLDLFDGEEGERGYNDDMSVINSGIPIINRQEEFLLANKTKHWLLTSKLPLFDKNNKPYGLIGIGRDITDQHIANETIIQERKLLRTLIDNLPYAIYIKDKDARKIIANAADIKIMNCSSESEILGKTDLEIFHTPYEQQGYYEDMDVLQNHRSMLNKEDHYTDRDGVEHWRVISKFPLFDSDGQVTGLVGIGRDTTEQKKLETDLIAAKEKAEENDRLKSAFLANMSHEIRTPLNSIMGFASLLPEEDSKETIDQYSQIIVQNSEQLVSLIDGIVFYSKLQTGLYSLQETSFKAGELVNDIILSFNLPIYQQETILKQNCLIDMETTITADYDKVRQVITNLISNAFKYTPKGEIIIGCDRVNENIEFYIQDTGIGIQPKDIDHIFERFYRGSNIDESKTRGTGLGLSIVKELVELLGGKLRVESTIGKGSKFSFTIPDKQNKT
ncbi:MAG TPA: PAS domain S-box protein [Prolixibacteraceae bacterium]|nr:PAS domain S-box protein [Prolixibacteraceae bacterium]